MQPNQNFLKYFPDADLPEELDRSNRSSCIRIGDYIVIRKIMEEYKFPEVLGHYIDQKDLGLFLDLVAYTIVTENNAGQYYPNYAFNHPLFTDRMRVYSDAKVSDLLHSLTDEQLESKIRQIKQLLKKHVNEVKTFCPGFDHYFILHYNEKTKQFQFAEEKTKVIEDELDLSGYFCIITSERMTAKEAICLYKSRDSSEKLFRGDKSYLGNNSLRVSADDAFDTKIFIEFVALIVRNRIYTCLKEKMKDMDKKPNFMTVPAALKELEKIEMVRLTDNVYRLDHAATKTQKTILSAFGIDAPLVKCHAQEISKNTQRMKKETIMA